MQSTYWAASSINEIANHIINKKDEYYKFLESSGILEELRRSYSLFYGNSAIDQLEDGKTVMSVNHYASLIRSLHVLVTQNRPAFDARSVNSDYRSQATTTLANGLLDYYMREKRLEEHLKNACQLALYLREGWITAEWNTQSGEIYGVNPESNTPVFEGDVEFNTYSILDIIRPSSNPKHNWFIIRKQKNKYDLAAQFPELQDEIMGNLSSIEERKKWSLSYIADTEKDSDDVEVLCFYHAKTPALPQGRYAEVVGNTVIIDGPLPYKKPYIFAIKAMDAFQTAFGHSPAMDLMPLQTALDSCFSVVLSNVDKFGLGTLVSEEGSLKSEQLQAGLINIVHKKGSQPPQVLNLLQTPPEIFNFANMLVQNQETISGVNAVSRGNVPHQMSGAAMALIAQQTLVFSSGIQQSYNSLIENVGTSLIELLQTYAVSPRIAFIPGKTKKALMKEFKGQDLQGITRIIVESSNAFTETTAGKVEVANNLLNSGKITTAEQYITVVRTGQLESLVEHDQATLLLIKQENELLSEGKPVYAVITDNDRLHILEHSTVFADPDVRQDPRILQNAFAHIQEHINNAKTKDPMLSTMLGQQPLAQPPPTPPQDGQVNPQNIGEVPPLDMQSAPLPNLPTNPLTGQKFDPSNPG